MTWIPVTKRLPKNGVKVDIWLHIYASPRSMGFGDSDREINCWRQDGKWVHYYKSEVAEIYSDYVTHWMPIAKPPRIK